MICNVISLIYLWGYEVTRPNDKYIKTMESFNYWTVKRRFETQAWIGHRCIQNAGELIIKQNTIVHWLKSRIVHLMIQAWNVVKVHSLIRWTQWEGDCNQETPLKAIFTLGYFAPVLYGVSLNSLKTILDIRLKISILI